MRQTSSRGVHVYRVCLRVRVRVLQSLCPSFLSSWPNLCMHVFLLFCLSACLAGRISLENLKKVANEFGHTVSGEEIIYIHYSWLYSDNKAK